MPTETLDGDKLVSIICRSIGRPELKQALSSVAAQTYPNIELLLVDAAARDLGEFENYCKPVPLRLVSTGKAMARSRAANAGLDAAAGDYLMFLDDDDWIAPGHVRNLVDYLDSQDEIRAVYSSTRKTDKDGNELEEVFQQDFDPLMLKRDNYIPIHAMLFSKSLLGKDCRFDESLDIFEDWDFWLQLSTRTDFHHIEEVTAFYREGGQGETADGELQDRYDDSNPVGRGRAALFEKWMRHWDGAELNRILGSVDNIEELLELTSQLRQSHKSLQEQEGQLHQRLGEIARLNDKLIASHKELNKLYSEIHLDKKNLAIALAQADHFSHQLAHKEAIEAAQNKRISDLEKLQDRIFNSLTWKLMGPFRRLGRILGRAWWSLIGKPGPTVAAKPAEDEQPPPQSRTVVPDLYSPIRYSVDAAMICSDVLFVRGWALSDNGIESVEVIYGGKSLEALYGQRRDDIGEENPDLEDSETSGYLSFQRVDGIHELRLVIVDKKGFKIDVPVAYTETTNLGSLSEYGDFTKLEIDVQYYIYKTQKTFERSQHKFDESDLEYRPLVSIIVPVYNISRQWLNICIESVLNQIYSNWELCLYDDASTNQETLDCLKEWEGKDPRIKIEYGKKNLHISGASNKALAMTTGEFVGLMDNDDELADEALYRIVELLNEHRDADYIYSDEDKIDEDGEYIQPHFKPDWSPDLLESMMYVGHFSVIRKSIIEQAGGFREGFEGSQDYDLTLRIAEITNAFYHVPHVLYHWRIIPSSVSGGGEAKQYAFTSAIKALQDHLDRSDFDGTAENTEYVGLYRSCRTIDKPSVKIIIPFHNKADMTIDCLQSIENSSYDNFSIFLISNNSDEEQFEQVKQFTADKKNIELVVHDEPFNWAAMNNWAATQCECEYLLFLNNDIKVISEDWIEAMLQCGVKENVGAVGAKLLYEDDTVQHAGIIMQIGGIAGHAFRYLPDDEPGYFGYASVIRNCSAVTGACMLVRRSLFEQLHGFDESLRVAYNDVDFCLRLHEANYQVVYTPFARLYHLESKSRPKTTDDMSPDEFGEFLRESNYIRNRHPLYFDKGDPYYNPNLTLKMENFSLNI